MAERVNYLMVRDDGQMMPDEPGPDSDRAAGAAVLALAGGIGATAAVLSRLQSSRSGRTTRSTAGIRSSPAASAMADGGTVGPQSPRDGHLSRSDNWDWDFKYPRGGHAEPPRKGAWSQ